MVLDTIRIGDFQETAPLELPIHWRNILEDEEGTFEFLMRTDITAEEVGNSEIAMDLVFRLDKED